MKCKEKSDAFEVRQRHLVFSGWCWVRQVRVFFEENLGEDVFTDKLVHIRSKAVANRTRDNKGLTRTGGDLARKNKEEAVLITSLV